MNEWILLKFYCLNKYIINKCTYVNLYIYFVLNGKLNTLRLFIYIWIYLYDKYLITATCLKQIFKYFFLASVGRIW